MYEPIVVLGNNDTAVSEVDDKIGYTSRPIVPSPSQSSETNHCCRDNIGKENTTGCILVDIPLSEVRDLIFISGHNYTIAFKVSYKIGNVPAGTRGKEETYYFQCSELLCKHVGCRWPFRRFELITECFIIVVGRHSLERTLEPSSNYVTKSNRSCLDLNWLDCRPLVWYLIHWSRALLLGQTQRKYMCDCCCLFGVTFTGHTISSKRADGYHRSAHALNYSYRPLPVVLSSVWCWCYLALGCIEHFYTLCIHYYQCLCIRTLSTMGPHVGLQTFV